MITDKYISEIRTIADQEFGRIKRRIEILCDGRIERKRFEEEIKPDADCATWTTPEEDFLNAVVRLIAQVQAAPRVIAINDLLLTGGASVEAPRLKLVCFVSALKESAVKLEPKEVFAVRPLEGNELDRMTTSGTDRRPSELALFMASRLWTFGWIGWEKNEGAHNRVAGYFQAVIDAVKRRARALPKGFHDRVPEHGKIEGNVVRECHPFAFVNDSTTRPVSDPSAATVAKPAERLDAITEQERQNNLPVLDRTDIMQEIADEVPIVPGDLPVNDLRLKRLETELVKAQQQLFEIRNILT